jgi:hypothetical protein
VRTIPTTTLFRSTDGMSESVSRLARAAGTPGFTALAPRAAIAVNIGADILHSPTYHVLPPMRRYHLAARCFAVTWWRFALGHTLRTTVAALARALRHHLPAPAYSGLRGAYQAVVLRRRSPERTRGPAGTGRSPVR